MNKILRRIVLLCAFTATAAASAFCADAKAGGIVCVGLYSETSDGYASSRAAGKGEWVPIKVGDVLPAGAEIKINVDRDWVEFIAAGKPTVVYEIVGPEKGELIMKVADVLKAKPRTVAFPKGTASAPDPKFKDKLVVTQYLGRQVYRTADGDSSDIKYGDVLDAKGKVRIIAINNTLNLMNAAGATTTVVGPLNFNVDQVLNNKSLYKYLNVQK